MSVAVPGCADTPRAVCATFLTARLTTRLREGLLADLGALARLLSRTAAR